MDLDQLIMDFNDKMNEKFEKLKLIIKNNENNNDAIEFRLE
jgi:hypothetical protein